MTKHIGLIEIKQIHKIDFSKMSFTQNEYFLLDINTQSKKVYATYGPFDNQDQVKNHAAFLGLEIIYE